ncbi:MAG: hypothetical protein ACI83P_001229 [Janthinobacterium sp.]|jgi:hypothetical protein
MFHAAISLPCVSMKKLIQIKIDKVVIERAIHVNPGKSGSNNLVKTEAWDRMPQPPIAWIATPCCAMSC